MRKALAWFASLMEKKLARHDDDRGPRGWEGSSTRDLFERLQVEVAELHDAIRDRLPTQKVVDDAVDVANFAMMVADVLIPSPPEPDVLEEAGEVVAARMRRYGPPSENHARTAKMWSAYLGTPITARTVCIMNVLQKASRDRNLPKRDNLVDIAGYARNAEIVSPSIGSLGT